jgi:4-diphosphocytidyl-2C-methyl-D-erythritol kinase
MTNLNDRYSAVVSADILTTKGLEYYIRAYDGINYTYAGTADAPYSVTVQLAVDASAKGDVNGDGVITNLDALMLLQAANDLLNLTAEQFARADSVPDLPHPSADAMIDALRDGNLAALCDALGNSFEAVIGLPEIEQCRRILLDAGALGARMTGSGSTVFGIFPTESAAQQAAPLIQAALPDCGVFPCRPAAQGIEVHV